MTRADRTNAERQRRYIARLKAKAQGSVSNATTTLSVSNATELAELRAKVALLQQQLEQADNAIAILRQQLQPQAEAVSDAADAADPEEAAWIEFTNTVHASVRAAVARYDYDPLLGIQTLIDLLVDLADENSVTEISLLKGVADAIKFILTDLGEEVPREVQELSEAYDGLKKW